MVVENLQISIELPTDVINNPVLGRGDPVFVTGAHKLCIRKKARENDRGQKFVCVKAAGMGDKVLDGHNCALLKTTVQRPSLRQ